MAGSNQHFIPQFLQRQFGDASTGKPGQPKRIWVYKRGEKPALDEIERTGAGHHFYSEVAPDGTETLDTRITDREGPLANRIRKLLDATTNTPVKVDTAISVVNLLAPRTAHFRETYAIGFALLIQGLDKAFSDVETVKSLIGLNDARPGVKFREKIWPEVRDWPHWRVLQLPEPVIEDIAFRILQERFGEFYAGSRTIAVRTFGLLVRMMPRFMKNAQTTVLSRLLDANSVRKDLRKYQWSVREVQSGQLILPDCIAIGVTSKGQAYPFMHGTDGVPQYVIVPLSPKRALVGAMPGALDFDLSMLNEMSAQCSHEFFCASDDTFEHLSDKLGALSTATMAEMVSDALNDILMIPAADREVPAVEQAADVAGVSETGGGLPSRYSISTDGPVDQEKFGRVVDTLKYIVHKISEKTGLQGLEGIRFLIDSVPATAGNADGEGSDRDVPASQSPINRKAMSMSMIEVDGVTKVRLILPESVATNLISENQEDMEHAIQVLMLGLWKISYIQKFDEKFRLMRNDPIINGDERRLLALMYPAIESFCATVEVPGIWENEREAELDKANLVECLDGAKSRVDRARLVYRYTGDFEVLMGVLLDELRPMLRTMGRYLAHSAVFGRDNFGEGDALWNALERWGLRQWVPLFRKSLCEFYEKREAWGSLDDLSPLLRHAERVLWSLKIFPAVQDDGHMFFHMPVVLDMHDLQNIPREELLPPHSGG